MDRAEVHRRFFAELITAQAGVPPGRLLDAFAMTPRERFIGPAPWKFPTSIGYIEAPSDDVTFLYRDCPVALAPERGINNGQPVLHAMSLAALDPQPGETAIHVGAGTGYYTAILARMIAPDGQVFAYEMEEDLARRAVINLEDLPNVTVRCQSGSQGTLPYSDLIYVSAGATAPQASWLDALLPGGRLVFPLTPDEGSGAMLLMTRPSDSSDHDRFHARAVSLATFIGCVGARDTETGRKLTHAFRRKKVRDVRSLFCNNSPDETCWVAGDGWWLSTAPLSGAPRASPSASIDSPAGAV
jgi:protein-L-isoaspartate(D-aspartate) O-methyltransferase